MQIEMMSESIDETLDKDEAEEETEELTNQVKQRQPQSLFLLTHTRTHTHSQSFDTILLCLIYIFCIFQVLDEIGVDIASQVGFFLRFIIWKEHFPYCFVIIINYLILAPVLNSCLQLLKAGLQREMLQMLHQRTLKMLLLGKCTFTSFQWNELN